MTTTSGTNTGSVSLTTVSDPNASTQSFVIAETAYTFMRAKTITFTAQGLKPNTVYYPFFNDVFVGEFCTSKNTPVLTSEGKIATADQEIKTDAIGAVIGNFYLPAGTFVTGSHKFKLVDNVRTSGSATVADAIYGSAEALYEATGILKQQQIAVTDDLSQNSPKGLATPVVPTVVTPPPAVVCESWYFEYQINKATQRTFSITTSSSTPPSTPPSPQTGKSAIAGSVTYVSTAPVERSSVFFFRQRSSGYKHTYRYLESVGSESGRRWRQEWIGKTTDTPPSLTNFRPSGLESNSVVNIVTPWTKIGSVACPAVLGLKSPVRRDPLAQSFFIDAENYPNGMFTTAVGVYFRRADQSTPAILELREMSNGVPGSNVLPGGSVVLPGYAAASSDDASVSTVFRFDHPVYLRPSTDYCFVLKSTSLGYEAWTSRMGEIDVADGKVIESQPFSGTLFKSENDVTWIPDSYEDLKFDLYKADFDTNTQGNLIFRPQEDTAKNVYVGLGQQLPLSFISTTKDSQVVSIKIPMHSLANNDKIFVEGVATPTPSTAYNNILAEDLNGEHVVTVIDEDNVTITTSGDPATRTGTLLSPDRYALINAVASIMPADVPIVPAQLFIDESNLAPSTVPASTSILTQPIPPVITSNSSFTVYTNIQANEVMIDYIGTELDKTTITENILMVTGQSTAGAETPYALKPYIEVNRDGSFYAFDEPRMLATPANEDLNISGNPSTEVNILLNSSHKDISPVINLNGMSIAIRSYKIDNQNDEITNLIDTSASESDFNNSTLNSEIASGTGVASAKYKGNVQLLATPSTRLSLFVVGNCPAPAQIDAYIRTSTDQSTHMDRDWTWMSLDGVFGTTFRNSSNDRVMTEWYYEHESGEPFTVFDIKLVMRSTNNSIIPKVYGVRTIADEI